MAEIVTTSYKQNISDSTVFLPKVFFYGLEVSYYEIKLRFENWECEKLRFFTLYIQFF